MSVTSAAAHGISWFRLVKTRMALRCNRALGPFRGQQYPRFSLSGLIPVPASVSLCPQEIGSVHQRVSLPLHLLKLAGFQGAAGQPRAIHSHHFLPSKCSIPCTSP